MINKIMKIYTVPFVLIVLFYANVLSQTQNKTKLNLDFEKAAAKKKLLKVTNKSFPSDADIQDLLKEFLPDARTSGIVAGLIEPDGERRIIAYGSSGFKNIPLSGESVMEIGSITKAFTGVLLADMVRRGEVKLDEPVARLLPDGVRIPSRNGKEITLLNLATHSSGLPVMPGNFPRSGNAAAYRSYTIEQMFDFLSNYELPRDPGESFEYSNFLSLLGHALALRAGKPYEVLLKERVLEPLKMEKTATTITPEMQKYLTVGHDRFGDTQPFFASSAFITSGSLKSNMNDMLNFAAAYLNESKTGIYATIEDTRRPHYRIGNSDEYMGLGIGTDARSETAGLAGGTFGFGSYFFVDLKTRRAVVVMTNYATPGSADPRNIGLYLIDPVKFPKKKPSIGKMFVADYQTSGVQTAIKNYRNLRRTARESWDFDESELNSVAYWLPGRGSIEDAVTVFRLNVEVYPASPNAYDSLGDGYRRANRMKEAIEAYRKAVALAEKTNHPNLGLYRQSLDDAIRQTNLPK